MADEKVQGIRDQTEIKPSTLTTVRDEDFTSLYASNVQFESTLWDLRLLFGEVDVAQSKITQHTSMALSWPMAKLVAYYALVNVIFHQNNTGQIFIPTHLLPPRADPNEPSLDVAGKRVAAYLAWVHDQFFGATPYVPDAVAAYDTRDPQK